MTRFSTMVLVFLAAAAGLFIGGLFARDPAPAQAGGVCPMTGISYVTSGPDGDTLYEWRLETRTPYVVRYSYTTGLSSRKDLKPAPDGSEERPGETDTSKGPEIAISGVIWTPNPETRVAIINGKMVRQGDVFETRSGKRFKVVEIRKSEEVDYRPVDED